MKSTKKPKLILSRKGFDSTNGGQASPILPDGTLLSLPIPDDSGYDKYSSLGWNGVGYDEIISQLNPKNPLHPESKCHLDPDIRKEVKERPSGWMGAFGQMGAALSVLRKNNVGPGDIFMYFGWFRMAEYVDGKLRYVPGAPDLHIIYGYLQVDKIIEAKKDIPKWLMEHPHSRHVKSWEKNQDAIFLPSERLSICPSLPGYGTLDYRADRVLTKPGMTRGKWDMPDFFRDVEISYNRHPWNDEGGFFQSAGRGQEFVMDMIPEIENWANKIINN